MDMPRWNPQQLDMDTYVMMLYERSRYKRTCILKQHGLIKQFSFIAEMTRMILVSEGVNRRNRLSSSSYVHAHLCSHRLFLSRINVMPGSTRIFQQNLSQSSIELHPQLRSLPMI